MSIRKSNETHRPLEDHEDLVPFSDIVSIQPTPELRLFILEAVKNKEIALYEFNSYYYLSVQDLKKRFPNHEFVLAKRIYHFRKKYRKIKHASPNS